MFKNITRTVLLISLVSLMNDFSSEMLYPVIPLYLAQIGYGSLLIGFIEGLAEFLAGITKIYTGSLSDHFNKRLPFVQFGYILSTFSRPLIGLTNYAGVILLGRSADRIGKGIRSGARDALLADESTAETRAEVFGFHRSLDTLGAVIGPLVAMIYLYFRPNQYKALFLITLIPGTIAIFFTFLIKEKSKISNGERKSFSFKKHFSFYNIASSSFKKLFWILLLFSFVNSSDMFLLLKAKELGYNDSELLMFYLLFNIVYALFAFPIGKIADKIGKTQILILGIVVYAFSYFGFTFLSNLWMIVSCFILYGLFYALTQGSTKALLIQTVHSEQKSSAIGLYEGMNSIMLLLANSIAGIIYFKFHSNSMFIYTGIGALLVAVLLFISRKTYSRA